MDGSHLQPNFFLVSLCTLLVLGGSGFASTPSPNLGTNHDTPPGPDRYTSIFVDYIIHTWWIANWEDNAFVCEIITDHEGFPTLGEVYDSCGEAVYDKWVEQDPCVSTRTSTCEGVYLLLIDTQPAQREIAVALPPAVAYISLEDCSPISTSSTNLCKYKPVVVIDGVESLPNEEITGIAGLIDGEPFTCGSPCLLQLAETDEEGALIEFWAYSSYGDSSEVFDARVRVVEDDEMNPDQSYWYVDILSDQWTGLPVASCADSWEAFPPVGGPPEWLTTPKRAEDLTSQISYNYLAAHLIRAGVVDVDDCANGGLLLEDYGANTCGLDAAQSAVTEWQNRFDNLILQVAQETGVPAQMLKNLFARESQFWPALFEGSDIGLGQLTENGADTTLLWNSSFYTQFCPLILPSDRCANGYLHLEPEEQSYLRLGLINTVNATCEDCPLGIDLTRANFSVSVFGHTLLANCEQTGRILRNVSGQAPGEVASYEDLWKFTLVNYNAGPGCLGEAIQTTDDQKQPFTWDNVSSNLNDVCSEAVDYVANISQ